MKMNVMTQQIRLVQKRHLEAATETDSVVSKRFSKVEEQMQATSKKLWEEPDDARLCKVEGCLQELQSTIREMQIHSAQERQHSNEVVRFNQASLHVHQNQSIHLESSQRPLLLLQRLPQPQSQAQETSLPHQRQGHCEKRAATLPLAQQQKSTNHVQQHSRVAKWTQPDMIHHAYCDQKNAVDQNVALRRSPAQQCGTTRQSPCGPDWGVAQR
eukprot:CAMPEP_0172857212 /NCGR_PEP_ID=MMETSP1075-20121228/64490_1 /TAXON_ID=2916 /ORGANISM="Ceratium fusus, Strain PA161109" /LENGTH=213 /DNA_ID=CAMNT_0013704503 /DNA_START=1 /DNA_END=639 /DNA_ORIENTATION=-